MKEFTRYLKLRGGLPAASRLRNYILLQDDNRKQAQAEDDKNEDEERKRTHTYIRGARTTRIQATLGEKQGRERGQRGRRRIETARAEMSSPLGASRMKGPLRDMIFSICQHAATWSPPRRINNPFFCFGTPLAKAWDKIMESKLVFDEMGSWARGPLGHWGPWGGLRVPRA